MIIIYEFEKMKLIVDLIKTSFADVAVPTGSSSHEDFSHELLVSMRQDLHVMSSEALQYYLPAILVDSIMYLEESRKDQSIVDVVTHLDVECTLQATGACEKILASENALQCDIQDSIKLSRRKKDAYKLFTEAQSKAIYSWLRVVRDWECLRYAYGEVKGALDYWKMRSSIGQAGSVRENR